MCDIIWSMKLTKGAPLKNLSSMQIGGEARFLAQVLEEGDIPEAVKALSSSGHPMLVLGEGSNTVFGDGLLDIAVLKIENKGIEIIKEDSEKVLVSFGAGENWDDVVLWSVEKGFSGIEALSMIPGTAGATPVQNVGAYGQEIADTLVEVRGYDTKTKEFKTLSKKDCGFSYRSSVFKEGKKNAFIISSIVLSLRKSSPEIPTYHSIKSYFEGKKIGDVSVAEIRKAVMEVRSKRLPDPKVVPNSGSFFKNPIVGEGVAKELQKSFPDMPSFDMPDGKVKLFSGWLIENSDFKIPERSRLSLFPGNSLVIVNNGGASFAQLKDFVNRIQEAVESRFGMSLEVEPNLIEG